MLGIVTIIGGGICVLCAKIAMRFGRLLSGTRARASIGRRCIGRRGSIRVCCEVRASGPGLGPDMGGRRMAQLGTVKVTCPACGKPWDVKIEAKLARRLHKPGQAVASVSVKKPIRVPQEHRECIIRVVG